MEWVKYKDVAQDGLSVDCMRSFTKDTKESVIAEALKDSYTGEYTIEDDGQPEPEPEPTQLDRVEAQVTYTAMMTDTLLEG